MSEKPPLRVIEGGLAHEERERDELQAVKAFMLDSAPEDWESEIDQEQLPEYRREIMKWSNRKLISFCENNYVWGDPTYAKALLEVIAGKSDMPRQSSK